MTCVFLFVSMSFCSCWLLPFRDSVFVRWWLCMKGSWVENSKNLMIRATISSRWSLELNPPSSFPLEIPPLKAWSKSVQVLGESSKRNTRPGGRGIQTASEGGCSDEKFAYLAQRRGAITAIDWWPFGGSYHPGERFGAMGIQWYPCQMILGKPRVLMVFRNFWEVRTC